MIAIMDYGVGNLRSVEKAFHFIGLHAEVTSGRDDILKAGGVVLPGVGAYADAMKSLAARGMPELVREVISRGKPFLGICLGLQLLFDYSEEGGNRVEGLGILRGEIRQLPLDMGLKVPHMGWNSLKTDLSCPLFKGISGDPHVYFVHSYFLTARDRSIVTATSEYGVTIDAAVSSGNVHATQFHPEKSGETGLKILKNWAQLINGNS